jgi:RNA polymerase sigma-70 factor (ECF subfamily)
MLGSFHDADDLVQETLRRAWRGWDAYEGRASLRTWLCRIATNACLDALATRARRALPVTAGHRGDPTAPLSEPSAEPVWLEPLPGSIASAATSDPAARYDMRESVTLAFAAALQRLSPRQRAVLILRDVLAWRAKEVADLLSESLSSVNSLLFRARRAMARAYPTPGAVPSDVDAKVLRRYVAAWENADVAALVALLRDDAILSMPPMPAWFRGRDAIGAFLRAALLADGTAGQWRYVPTTANGEAAFAVYGRSAEADGRYDAVGLTVVAVRGGQVAEITSFLDPRLVTAFGLPPSV